MKIVSEISNEPSFTISKLISFSLFENCRDNIFFNISNLFFVSNYNNPKCLFVCNNPSLYGLDGTEW